MMKQNIINNSRKYEECSSSICHEIQTKQLNPDEELAISQLLCIKDTISPPSTSTYCDYSNTDISDIPLLLGVARQLTDSFPVKLHQLLERSEVDGYSSIISWSWHGRSFKIHNQNLFVKKIMPMYFYQTKISSFVRQLSAYGFHRRSKDDKDSYYHELFLRGRGELCPYIVRQKKQSLMIDPKIEPDLSKFKPMPLSSKATTEVRHVLYLQPAQQIQLQQQQHETNRTNISYIKAMRLQSSMPCTKQHLQQHGLQNNYFERPQISYLARAVRNSC